MEKDPNSESNGSETIPTSRGNGNHHLSKWLEPISVYTGIATVLLVLTGVNVNYVVTGRITDVTRSVDRVEDDLSSVAVNIQGLTDTVNTSQVEQAKFRMGFTEGFVKSINDSKTEVIARLAQIESSSSQSEVQIAKVEASQHKVNTDLASIRSHVNYLESNIGQAVSEVEGNVGKVTDEFNGVKSSISEVNTKVAAITGAVEATTLVTGAVDDQQDKLKELENNQTETQGKLSDQGAEISRQSVMLQNGIVHRDVVRVVSELFDQNTELNDNPSLLSTILASKAQVGPRQFWRDLRDKSKYVLEISDEGAVVISFYEALLTESPKHFYDDRPALGAALPNTADTDGQQSGISYGTADDVIPGNYNHQSSTNKDSRAKTTEDTLNVNILDACAELVVPGNPRTGCYMHYLDKLSELTPGVDSPGRVFTESEVERIRRQNRDAFDS